MAVLTEPNRLNDILKDEQESPAGHSCEKVTVLEAQNLSLGAVIGKQLFTVPATGTKTGTGDGTMAGVTGGKKTKKGTYTVVCVTAVANGGKFSVVDPDGFRLADAVVGAAYASEQLNFTINDGETDFAAGDKFTVAVTAGSGKVTELDLDGTDGSQIACGFMRETCDATSADKKALAVVRNAHIVPANLVWPADITADQKTAALAELEAKGIVEVKEV